MGYTAQQLIAIAEAEVGYREKASNSQLDDKTANAGLNNWTKYARDLADAGYYNGNKNGYDWCDVFVDWCHYTAANRDADEAQRVICQSGPYGAGCYWSRKYYKDADRLYYSPQPGDQIFFDWDLDGEADHTGIVRAVDDDTVYTIEGNTGNGSVAKKSYSLKYSCILGYGRPLYDESITEAPFTPNTEAVENAAKHNFFSVSITNIFPTKATLKINTKVASTYEWIYELISVLDDTRKSKKLPHTGINAVVITGLTPNSPYSIKVTAKNDLMGAEQQIFFYTPQAYPEAIKDLTVDFKYKDLESLKTCEVTFSQPNSWNDTENTSKKGYRLNFIVNGKIVITNDKLITYASNKKINKTISIIDLLHDKIKLAYGDTIQIGIQAWLKDEHGDLILDSNSMTCSAPIYLKPTSSFVNAAYVKILNDFKQAILWNNN